MLTKLKSLFAKVINQAAFIVYDKCESFKRPVDMNIIDFINDFERLYNNTEKYDMGLCPQGYLLPGRLKVLAYQKISNN